MTTRDWLIVAAFIAILVLALCGCTTQPPKQVVQYATVEVPKYIRAPIDERYIKDIFVVEPDPDCWIGTERKFCNGQTATMLDDYRALAGECRAGRAAIRAMQPQPEKP